MQPKDSTSLALPGAAISDTIFAAAPEKSNAALLQGKWQHSSDTSNYLRFEQNVRKEIGMGMDKWDEEIFVLSDRCMNESNKNNQEKREKDSYISCIASDLCWYILTLDSVNLSVSYMGRGNTLTYRRVR